MYPKTESLPEGYRKVSVIVTENEFKKLRFGASLSPHGTFSEAVRRQMGLAPSPHGLIAALRRQATFENSRPDGSPVPTRPNNQE